MKSVAGTFLHPENEKSRGTMVTRIKAIIIHGSGARTAGLKEEAYVQRRIDKACRAEEARRLREHSDFCVLRFAPHIPSLRVRAP